MFVRYRKLAAGGFRPAGVQAKIGCQGGCGRRRIHCPLKPRCRWRIGLGVVDGGIAPYRLHVSLVASHREGGRVRQEHVADLGSIEAWLLPEFWKGIDPAIAAQIKAENWDIRATKARVTFWQVASPRINRLANRLDPTAIRTAIDQRIPYPRKPERELAEARDDFRFWRGLNEQTTKMIEANEGLIASATKKLAELRENARNEALQASKAAARLGNLNGL